MKRFVLLLQIQLLLYEFLYLSIVLIILDLNMVDTSWPLFDFNAVVVLSKGFVVNFLS